MVFNATFKKIEDISRRTLFKNIWKQKKWRLKTFTQKLICCVLIIYTEEIKINYLEILCFIIFHEIAK